MSKGTTKAAKYISASFPRQIARKSPCPRIRPIRREKHGACGQNQRRQPHLLSFAESPSAFFRLSLFSRRSSFAGAALLGGRFLAFPECFFPDFRPFLFAGLATAPLRARPEEYLSIFSGRKRISSLAMSVFQAERARPAPISDLAGFCPSGTGPLHQAQTSRMPDRQAESAPSRGMEASSTKMPKSVTPLTEASKDFSFMPLKQQAAHAARHFPFTFHGLCAREH